MAEKKVDEILTKLEEVFSSVKEYDEALEDLGVTHATARRQYPKLFEALKFPSRLAQPATGPGPSAADVAGMIAAAVANSRADAATAKSQPTGASTGPNGTYVPAPAPTDIQDMPDIHIIPYSTWSLNEAVGGKLEDQWAVRWDVKGPGGELLPIPASMNGVGSSFVISPGGQRMRFQIVDMLDETTMILKLLRYLGSKDMG